jgi:hypothetical protein
VFDKLLKREKPRVYLGTLAVTPRSDIKRHFDQQGLPQNEDLDTRMRQSLKDLFSLPSAQDVKEPTNTDLGLDIIVSKFQSGDALVISLGEVYFPLLWRPNVTLSSRLYYLKSEKTKATFTVTEKMKWHQYIKRLFTCRSIFRFKPLFDRKDMDYLLCQACHKLLLKMQKSI